MVEIFRGLSQSLQTNPWMLHRCASDRSLPDPFQFIDRPAIQRYTRTAQILAA
jgi:hypothetical protein